MSLSMTGLSFSKGLYLAIGLPGLRADSFFFEGGHLRLFENDMFCFRHFIWCARFFKGLKGNPAIVVVSVHAFVYYL